MCFSARHGLGAVLLLGLVALAAGCGKGTSSTSPTTAMTQDAADDIAINSVAAVGPVATDVGGSVALTSGPAPQPGAANVTPTASETTFVKNGITFTITRTFYDSGGNPLTGFGLTAARLVWTSQAAGTFESPRDTAVIGHDASLIVTGNALLAAADTLIFNGASDDTLLNHFTSYDGTQQRWFHWVSNLAIADVRVAKTNPGFPASGTVTFTASADRLRSGSLGDVQSHWNATVVITFNGTNTADVVVNGVWHYHWLLNYGIVQRA